MQPELRYSQSCPVMERYYPESLKTHGGGQEKQKFGFIKQVDESCITTVKDLES